MLTSNIVYVIQTFTGDNYTVCVITDSTYYDHVITLFFPFAQMSATERAEN